MTVDRLGGMVEGQPTGAHNFLQRIDELRRAESALAEARAEALDDARVTVSRMVRNKLGQTDWNDVDDALVALKEKR